MGPLFGICIDALHPLLLKFVIETLLVYALIFVWLILCVERYMRSKTAMVLVTHLVLLRKNSKELFENRNSFILSVASVRR